MLLLWHVLVFTSVLRRMTLIGYAHSSQFMELQNLGFTTLNPATCAINVLKKLPENQITTDFIYRTSTHFVTTPHINY